MALNKQKLQSDILNTLKQGFNQQENTDPDAYFATIAEELSTAIDNYVRSGDVTGVQTTVASGIAVVAGAASGTTITTGQGKQNNVGRIV